VPGAAARAERSHTLAVPPSRLDANSEPSQRAVTPKLRRPGVAPGPRATQTIARILSATSQLLLARGYAGSTVEEIARVAGVSRASFYTYFPSKRDVLLALGAAAADGATELIRSIADLPSDWTRTDLEGWVARYFAWLDERGSFVMAWTQAAHEDEELRVAGMHGHLIVCRRLAQMLANIGDRQLDDPVAVGVCASSMVERAWSYCRLYEGTVDSASVCRTVARVLESLVRPVSRPE
jgi:AcrR family transcriptional regulator